MVMLSSLVCRLFAEVICGYDVKNNFPLKEELIKGWKLFRKATNKTGCKVDKARGTGSGE